MTSDLPEGITQGMIDTHFEPNDIEEPYDDGDAGYDAMMDEIVGDYFDRLRDRQELYKKLLLCDYHGNHNTERDNLEKELLINITGTDRDWKEDAGRHKDG